MTVDVTKAASSEIKFNEAPTVTSSSPIYIAHRGSASLYPEETMAAYNNAYKDGERFLECDVQTLSDGTLVLIHDATVDAVTTSTGNVNTFNASTWAALQIDADTWHGSNYGNALPAMTFQQLIDGFNGKAILVPEDKDQGSTTAMLLALRKAGVRRDQVLIQCFTLSNLAAAVRAGYPALWLNDGTGDPNSVVAAGVTYVGLSETATDAQIQGFLNAGLKVIMWTVNRRYRRDQLLALGVHGFFSDDPTYLKSNSALYTSDRFGWQTWAPGQYRGFQGKGNEITFAGGYRGKFFANDYWGFDTTEPGYVGCLLGYLSPIANPSAFTIDYKVTFDSAVGADDSRWSGLFIGTSDITYQDVGSSDTEGYHFLTRKNGTIQIYRKDVGSSSATMLSQNTTASTIAAGTEVAYRISVSGGTLTLSRLNSDGSVNYSTSATSTTYRGGYINLGRAGLLCKFRGVSVK